MGAADAPAGCRENTSMFRLCTTATSAEKILAFKGETLIVLGFAEFMGS